MAKLSTLFNDQTFIPGTGTPASGYKLFTYAANSSTKQTTYTDAAGTTPQANPIILNSSGWPASPIWLAAGSTYKFVLAPPTDTDPPTSAVRTVDSIPGLNDTSSTVTQWVASLVTPTYISAASFSLAGDQTTEFHVGRRLQFTTTAGTVYGTILTSAFATLTTVTMTMDSGQVLDVGLSVVNLSILRNDRLAVPGGIAKSGANIDITSLLGLTGVINEAHGANIASAATTNLTTATGNLVDVTGTTTITAIALADGAERIVRFTGILTLTNGASLVLPGGADITTAAGDFAVLRGYAAGVVRCVAYTRVDGKAVLAGLNFDGVVAAAVTTTWTRATAAGKYIYTTAAGATTQTLPLASTMPSGTAIAFFNYGAGTPTFARQGSDGISGLIGGGTSFVLNQYDAVILTTDGASWFCNFLNGATGLAPQTLQNVAASRSTALFTNSTPRTIYVMVAMGTSAVAVITASVDGQFMRGSSYNAAGGINFIAFPVPPGKTYTVANDTGTSVISTWIELR